MWTSKQKLNVLLIDDDEDEYIHLSALLLEQSNEPGYPHIHLDWLPSYETGIAALQARQHDVYLIDYRLGARSGSALLQEAKAAGLDAPVIILTGHGSYEVDLQAMQSGAADFLVKDALTLPLLERTIRFAIEHYNVQSRLEMLVKERTHALEQTVERLGREVERRERSENQFRTLANTTSAAILIVQESVIRYANPAARMITGYGPEELQGQPIASLVHPAYTSAIERLGEVQPWALDFPMRFELKIVKKDGQERWLDITAGQMDFESQAAWLMTAFDITERDQAERALKQARDTLQAEVAWRTAELLERRDELRSLYAAATALLTTLNLDELYGQILTAAQSAIPAGTHAWLHLLNSENGELELCAWRGLPIARHRHPPSFPSQQDYPRQAVAQRRTVRIDESELNLYLLKEGEGDGLAAIFSEELERPVEIGSFLSAPLVAEDRVVGALSLSSASTRTFSEANLHVLENFAAAAAGALQNALLFQNVERMASTDPLTQQLNRRAFTDAATRELERCRLLGQPAAALLIDLDHFKLINDRFGHPIGDQVLRGFVDRCCERIRKIDLLGRIGGDEFAVLLPRADAPAAAEIAERIRSSLTEAPIETEAGPVDLSVSIGITVTTADIPAETTPSDDLQALLRRADLALYAAKEAGRNSLSMV